MARDGSSSRGGDHARAGDLVGALMRGPLGSGLGEAQRAARAWYAANGDRERAHTTGVWLRDAPARGVDPVLVVRVDSGLLAAELGTNKELYLSRVALHGVRVSDIRFSVGGSPAERAHAATSVREEPSQPAPPLTPQELADVERACESVSPNLRQSVSRAMCASLRREKSCHTRDV